MERTKRGERFAVAIIGSVQKGHSKNLGGRSPTDMLEARQWNKDSLHSGAPTTLSIELMTNNNRQANNNNNKQTYNRQQSRTTRIESIGNQRGFFNHKIYSKNQGILWVPNHSKGVQRMDSKNRIHKEGYDQLLPSHKKSKGTLSAHTRPLLEPKATTKHQKK